MDNNNVFKRSTYFNVEKKVFKWLYVMHKNNKQIYKLTTNVIIKGFI